LRDAAVKWLVAIELGSDLPKEGVLRVAFDVYARFEILPEPSVREIGAADNRFGLCAGLEEEDLWVEAARTLGANLLACIPSCAVATSAIPIENGPCEVSSALIGRKRNAAGHCRLNLR